MSNRRFIAGTGPTFPSKTLTVVFGAIPATLFCWWAFLAILAGASQIASLGGVLFVLFGSAGLYGTYALWMVALGRESKAIVAGLVFGVVAMIPPLLTPSTILPDSDSWNGVSLTTALEASPLIVAIAWLTYFFLKAGFRADQPAAARTTQDNP